MTKARCEQMVTCKHCGTPMIGVVSFMRDKCEKYDMCMKCYSETKHRKVDKKELGFREELDKR